MIGAPVAVWAGGVATAAGASLATAGAVAAIAANIAVGVVTGALIGAATAAISGQDIFKGALKGAVIGGISAGVMSGLGMATGLSSAQSQLAKFGLEQTAGTGAVVESASVASVASPSASVTPSVSGAGAEGFAISPNVTPPAGASFSDSTAKVLAGVGEGAASAYGQIEAGEAEAESSKELAEFEAEQARINKASNIAGEFQERVANIKVPDWWSKYLNAEQTEQPGILAEGSV